MGSCVSRPPEIYKINKTTDHMFKVGGSFGRGDVSLELHAEIGSRSRKTYGEPIMLPTDAPRTRATPHGGAVLSDPSDVVVDLDVGDPLRRDIP